MLYTHHLMQWTLKKRLKGAPLIRRVPITKYWFILSAFTHLNNLKMRQYAEYSHILKLLIWAKSGKMNCFAPQIQYFCTRSDAYVLILTHLLCEKIEFWGNTSLSALSVKIISLIFIFLHNNCVPCPCIKNFKNEVRSSSHCLNLLKLAIIKCADTLCISAF